MDRTRTGENGNIPETEESGRPGAGREQAGEPLCIRRMSLEDIPQVERIERETFSVPWSVEAFRSSLCQKDTIYLVAEQAGEVCGYCGLYVSLDEGEIPNVAVDRRFRRRGIARAMLGELLRQGEARGVSSFFLEVRQGNAAALGLYEGLGFEAVGVRKNFYEKPREHAVIMWKK